MTQYARSYHERNKTRINAQQRARYDRAKNTAKGRKSKFGISQEQYDEMFRRQGGVCATCLRPETITRSGKIKTLAVDHDHETGRVRGLLCQRCNIALHRGMTPEILRRAADYMEGSSHV